MPARAEMTVDDGVRREEALGLRRRLASLHLPFPPTRRAVRVFRAIVEVAAPPASDIRQEFTLGNAVAA
jgi:hypothetical protein